MITHRVHTISLHTCSLQIITSIGHVQPFPAVADAFVNLRLRQLRVLLLHVLTHVKVIEQIRRSATETSRYLQSFTYTSEITSTYS